MGEERRRRDVAYQAGGDTDWTKLKLPAWAIGRQSGSTLASVRDEACGNIWSVPATVACRLGVLR